MRTPKQTIDGLMYDGSKVLAALAQSGFVVVPKEAPQAAIEAGNWVHDFDGADCYRKMVEAAAR